MNPTNNGDKNLRKSSEDKIKAPPAENIKTEPSAPKEDESNAKKPDWLQELSRKQANRRSAVFTSNESDTSIKSAGTSPPKIAESKPVVAPDKPHIPLKPSQIREEGKFLVQILAARWLRKFVLISSSF